MANGLNANDAKKETLSALADPNVFNGLAKDSQKAIIDSVTRNDEKDGGIMGKLFGTKKDLSSMHIAVFICFLIFVLCLADVIHSMYIGKDLYSELTRNCLAIFTLALGYIFGKSDRS